MVRIALYFCLLFLSSNLLLAQSGQTTIPAKEFKSLLTSQNGVLIDVRTSTEVNRGKIENAQNIDWLAGDFASKVSGLDKSKPVFVYCAVGGRSSKAKSTLEGLGFKVYELEGGIKAWQKAGFALVQ